MRIHTRIVTSHTKSCMAITNSSRSRDPVFRRCLFCYRECLGVWVCMCVNVYVSLPHCGLLVIIAPRNPSFAEFDQLSTIARTRGMYIFKKGTWGITMIF